MENEDFNDMTEEELDSFIEEMEREHAPFEVVRTLSFKNFLSEFKSIGFGCEYYSPTEDLEQVIVLYTEDNHKTIVYNLSGFSEESIIKDTADFVVEQRRSGHYVLCITSL